MAVDEKNNQTYRSSQRGSTLGRSAELRWNGVTQLKLEIDISFQLISLVTSRNVWVNQLLLKVMAQPIVQRRPWKFVWIWLWNQYDSWLVLSLRKANFQTIWSKCTSYKFLKIWYRCTNDYRRIWRTAALCKFFEEVSREQIGHDFNKNKVLCPRQFGLTSKFWTRNTIWKNECQKNRRRRRQSSNCRNPRLL